MPSRFRVLDLVQTLDPERDHQRIVRLSGLWDFPWDGARALELALFRTFAVPSIGGLLHRTGEFEQRTQRRYDDTELLVAEMVEWGYDSPRGARALDRMNEIHARYRIRNEDFLYVLSTFVLEPLRWNARFGWRPVSAVERQAGFLFWREVGRRMGIEGIPGSLQELDGFNRAFEAEHFRHTPAGEKVARATLELFCSWYLPKPLWPLGVRGVCALLDEPLLSALALPRPAPAERALAEGILRARGRALRHLPGRVTPKMVTDTPHRSYPRGYVIERLGPEAAA